MGREELLAVIEYVAENSRMGKVEPGDIADAILRSEWLDDIRGEAWSDGHAQGYDEGFDAGQDDGFIKGAHINEGKTFVS